MPDFIRRHIREMTAYVPGAQPADLESVIKLNTNENGYPPSPRVHEALRDWMVHGRSLRYYPDPTCTQIREIAGDLFGLSRDEVIVGNGSDEILRLAVTACAGPGRSIAGASPTYSLYPVLARIQDADYEAYPFQDPDTLPAGLRDSSAVLIFVANPNPPYGTVFPADAVAALCGNPARLIVADEAYADFSGVTAVPRVRDHANLLVSRTLSKSYALAGDRIGLGYGDRELIATLNKIRDSYNVSTLAQVAAIAALSDQDYFKETRDRIRATRDRVRDALLERGAEVPPSGANFVFARFPGLAGALLQGELESRGILIRYFRDPLLEDGVRISVGTDPQMDRFLDVLDEILRANPRRSETMQRTR